MNSKLRSVARLLKQAVSTLALLLLLLVVGASIAAYLAVTGRSLPLLRLAAARVGQLVAGQRTQHLTLEVLLSPAEGRLTGSARLLMQSLEDSRQRFYFLLNDGLRIRRGNVESSSSTVRPVSIYQLWLLTVVDVGTPVSKGDTVQLTLDYDGVPARTAFDAVSASVDPQRVLLGVDSFWYPNDRQSFFSADVTTTVPSSMTVVHNGVRADQFERGDVRQTHWTTERPVAGLALVAGQYNLATAAADGITYRLYLPAGVQLDATRILTLMREANGTLASRYGDSGFHQVTLFVDRTLRRDFNDGSGLIGVSTHHFRTGDYGFATTAHNVAHNWWGATVAGKWLSPGTGGAWIVEGLSEFSSLLATEAKYGAEALWRRRGEHFFDPAHDGVIAQMSAFDDARAGAKGHDTIYHKGASVALMLRQQLGDETCYNGLRQFLGRFKFQQATDRDLQQVLQEVSQQNLERFFTDWVRGDHAVDLSLDSNSQSEVAISNRGAALLPGDIDLWTFKRTGGEPARSTVRLGNRVALDVDADYVVADPLLLWADVQRENNRYPRGLDPVYVAASSRGDLAVTLGELLPWMRTSVAQRTPDGRTVHAWDFSRGMLEAPSWSPDGTRLIASYSESPDALPAIVTLAIEGAQRTIGRGTTPAAGVDGTVYAGKQERIVGFNAQGAESTLVERRGESLDRPLPSPDGSRIVYSAVRDHHTDLRIIHRDGSNDRLVSASDSAPIRYCWSADGTRLYAIAGGNWDWQIWDIPVDAGSIATLATGAAAISSLALSPDGSELAFTAAPELDYPNNRSRLYVLRLNDRTVRSVDVPDTDLGHFTWSGTDSIVVVASQATADRHWMRPATRVLKRVRISDGSIEDLP